MGWILDHYMCLYQIIFINFGSLLNFGEKIENFSKIKICEIFLFGKNSKNIFFSSLKFVQFFFQKIKLWEVLYLMLPSHEKILSRWKVSKLWNKKIFFQCFFIFHEKKTIFLCKKMCRNFCRTKNFFQKIILWKVFLNHVAVS